MNVKRWYKLDNVGKFYSSIADRQAQNIFRYSATLKENINKDVLQNALNETMNVFENFNVNLKKGLFWYYLDETNKKVKVTSENLPICFKLYTNSDDLLYRVTYFKNRINFEVSHILTDGRGSVELFKTLVSNYIKLKYKLKDLDLTTNTSYIEKSEDSFSKYYQKPKKDNSKMPKIYLYKGKKLKTQTRFLEAHLSVKKVLDIAHSYNATLTSLLVSVLIYSFKDVMKESDFNETIKIDIPVDLRSYFKSTSSRNYFGLTSVLYKFKSRDDKLEDIIAEVNRQFKENLTAEKLSRRVNVMVAFEKNIFCRVIPIFLKNIVLKIINHYTTRMISSSVSNIGRIQFDDEISEHIENVNVLASTTNFKFTICSFKDDLSIGISSVYKYNEVIKNFCKYFSNQDVEMTINVSEVD